MDADEALRYYLLDVDRVRRYGVPKPEHKFAAPHRLWRFDWAWPHLMLACEREGGTFSHTDGVKSRHTTGTGMRDDAIKYDLAAVMGWAVLRFTTDMIESGVAWTILDAALEERRSRYTVSAAPQTPLSAPMVALIQAMPKQYRSAKKKAPATPRTARTQRKATVAA